MVETPCVPFPVFVHSQRKRKVLVPNQSVRVGPLLPVPQQDDRDPCAGIHLPVPCK